MRKDNSGAFMFLAVLFFISALCNFFVLGARLSEKEKRPLEEQILVLEAEIELLKATIEDLKK